MAGSHQSAARPGAPRPAGTRRRHGSPTVRGHRHRHIPGGPARPYGHEPVRQACVARRAGRHDRGPPRMRCRAHRPARQTGGRRPGHRGHGLAPGLPRHTNVRRGPSRHDHYPAQPRRTDRRTARGPSPGPARHAGAAHQTRCHAHGPAQTHCDHRPADHGLNHGPARHTGAAHQARCHADGPAQTYCHDCPSGYRPGPGRARHTGARRGSRHRDPGLARPRYRGRGPSPARRTGAGHQTGCHARGPAQRYCHDRPSGYGPDPGRARRTGVRRGSRHRDPGPRYRGRGASLARRTGAGRRWSHRDRGAGHRRRAGRNRPAGRRGSSPRRADRRCPSGPRTGAPHPGGCHPAGHPLARHVTGGDGLRHRHAGHRCGCPPSADRRHGDRHRGPRCDGNRRTVAWRRPGNHPPRPAGRRDANCPHPAPNPGGYTARRNWTRGPGTSLNRHRPARTSQSGADRPGKACRSTRSRPGRRGYTRHRQTGRLHLPMGRTFWPFQHGEAPSRPGRNPGPQSRPRPRGMRRPSPGNRQNRRGTGLSPSSGGPSSGPGRQLAGQAGRTGMGRRGPARCRHCHDRSRPLCPPDA
jgi:hypothetical protein